MFLPICLVVIDFMRGAIIVCVAMIIKVLVSVIRMVR